MHPKVPIISIALYRVPPETILFSQINYQPLLKKVRKDKPVNIDAHLILLQGESVNGDRFADWINTLEKREWVAKVLITNYSDLSRTRSTFEVMLKLKYD